MKCWDPAFGSGKGSQAAGGPAGVMGGDRAAHVMGTTKTAGDHFAEMGKSSREFKAGSQRNLTPDDVLDNRGGHKGVIGGRRFKTIGPVTSARKEASYYGGKGRYTKQS